MVEAVVNGRPVGHRSVTADGELREFSIEVPIQRSSWVALRILPSGHTNPIFVRVEESLCVLQSEAHSGVLTLSMPCGERNQCRSQPRN